MKNIFGVNSITPANKRLKNGYTLYEWIMRQRCFPSFWARTILGDNPITKEEIEFLHNKDCKIAFVMRDLTEVKVSSSSGTEDALRVINKAEKFNLPKNRTVAIFAEIGDDWSINHNWMLSFAATLYEEGYLPGFIGNTDSSKNFNFDRQCSHYVEASENMNQFGAIYCATEPKLSTSPQIWEPYCPSALNPKDIHLWICGKTKFCDIETDDIYARDEIVLDCMW